MCEGIVRICTKLFICARLFSLPETYSLPLKFILYERFGELNNEDVCNSITWTYTYLGVDKITACKVLVIKPHEKEK
jgi:hypothetical protein